MDGDCIEKQLACNNYSTYYRNATKSYDKSRGHGRGGVCYLIKKTIKNQPKFHSNGLSQLNIKGSTIIGVYLPSNKKEYESIFRLELELLKNIIIDARLNNKDIYAVGDFNVDLKVKPNLRNKLLINLMNDLDLIAWDMIYCSKNTYTYFKDNDKTHIDHVIGNSNNINVNKIQIYDDISMNRSDHYGIILNFNIKIDPNFRYMPVVIPQYNYYWNMSYFKNKYDMKLLETTQKLLPEFKKLLCITLCPLTRNNKFENMYEILHKEIKSIADSSGDMVKDKIASGKIKYKPWWNQKIINQHKESVRYHKAYLETKNDNYEVISKEIDKKIRNEIRELESKYRRNEHLDLEKIRFCDTKKFWNIIDNKMNKKVMCETNIDETKAEFFKTFNQKLVNSDDTNDAMEIENFINNTRHVVYNEYVNELEVSQIIKELDNGKSTGHRQVSNEMFKYSNRTVLATILTIIIRLLINYGCMFKEFNTSIIKPIVKDVNKHFDQINNIRPISISDVFHTIIEKWLLRKILETYNHCSKQFGFRRGHSCQHAIVTVLETIKSAKRKKKRALVCLIDASKAFDKMNRIKLWKMMLSFCKPAVLRFLIQYYGNSYAYIDINGTKSEKFKTSLGVKQGGCLSPLLYAIYVSDISDIVDRLNVGVKVGGQLVNILMYADDIALLTETKKDMKILLDAITDYGHDKEIKFNGTKTNLLIFNKKSCKIGKKKQKEEDEIQLKLDNEPIIEVNQAKYLGFHLSTDNLNLHHYNNRIENFTYKIMKLNKLDFDKDEMPSNTKSMLYKVHVRPVLFYGMDCLTLKQTHMDTLYTTEGNTIKLAHNLYTGIKSTELFIAMGMDTTYNVLKLNKLKLFLRLCRCSYTSELLQSIINENNFYQVKDSIINEIMEITMCDDMELENLVECAKTVVNEMSKAFKREKKENETATHVRYLLNKMPKNKNIIETILKSYEYNNEESEDEEDINIGDMYWNENMC